MIREIVWPPVPNPRLELSLSTRIPSTTSSGSLLSEMLLDPRMRICCAVPAVPAALMICTPAARPWIRLPTFVGIASAVTSSAVTVAIALGTSTRRCSPVAVTTISSRLTTARESGKLSSGVAAAETVSTARADSYPIRIARTVT